MSNDSSIATSPGSSDWDHGWKGERRLDTAHKPLESETVAIVAPASGHGVWILVGALWISIGMIVSATVVTVAFLA